MNPTIARGAQQDWVGAKPSTLILPTSVLHADVASDGGEEFFGAAPEGDPAGFAIAGAHQEAAEAGQVAVELSHGEDRFAAQ